MTVTSVMHESSDLTHRSKRLCTIQLCFKNSANRLTTKRVTKFVVIKFVRKIFVFLHFFRRLISTDFAHLACTGILMVRST